MSVAGRRAIAMAIALLPGLPAVAQPAVGTAPPPPESTAHRHLGFFLRLHPGFGYVSSAQPSAAFGDQTVSGPAVLFGIAIGGALTENLVLAGHVWYAVVSNPSLSSTAVPPDPTPGSRSTADNGAFFGGLGPSLTYYFMPANIYVSATPSITRFQTRVNGVDRFTNRGFGAQLAVGKEWWVSDHWGLGLAGEAVYSSNSVDTPGFGTITTWAGGLAFSATYN